MQIVLPVLFALAALTHLIACGLGRQRLRYGTKVLLVPLLFGVYCLRCAQFSPLVAAALGFGWLGDIFMIFKSDSRGLTVGIGSFAVGHGFYLAAMAARFPAAPPLWALIVLPLFFAAAAVGFYLFLRRDVPAGLRIPSLGYCLLLCAVGAVAALTLLAGAPSGGLLLSGALCFLVSDSVLSVEIFRLGDTPRTDFIVMLTYLAAQTLLTAAFCLPA